LFLLIFLKIIIKYFPLQHVYTLKKEFTKASSFAVLEVFMHRHVFRKLMAMLH